MNTDSDPGRFKKLCDEHGVTWPNVFSGAGRELPRSWGVEGYPTFLLVDHEGIIRSFHEGIDAETLDREVADLLSKAAAAGK